MNKTQVNKLLVEERKRMREKQKQSLFMKRSLSIYNGQKKRAEEKGVVLPFTTDELRNWLRPFIDTICGCGDKITISKLTVDHKTPIARDGSFDITNLAAMCQRCNWRKGSMLEWEFDVFVKWVEANLTPESKEDLYRRLVLGGKWSFK